MGGMGKTALASEAAAWWTRSGLFRDGACFVSFEQFTSAERVVQVFGCYVAGENFNQLPPGEQRRRAIEFMQQQQVLLVWDNFESTLPQFNDAASPYTDDERRRLAELFADLTRGPGRGAVLVTCRPGETGLPGARRHELHGLARADSLWLLAEILQRHHQKAQRPPPEPRETRAAARRPRRSSAVDRTRRPASEDARARGDPRRLRQLLARFEQDAPPAPDGEQRPQLVAARLARILAPPPQRRRARRAAVARPVPRRRLRGRPARRQPARPRGLGADPRRVAGNRPRSCRGRDSDREPPLPALPPDARRRRGRRPPRAAAGDAAALHRRLWGGQADAAQDASRLAIARRAGDSRPRGGQLPLRRPLGDWRWDDPRGRWPGGNVLRLSGDVRPAARARCLGERCSGTRRSRARSRQKRLHYERQAAWTRFQQGDPQGAVAQLQALIERLRSTSEFDPAFQLASAVGDWGRLLLTMRALRARRSRFFTKPSASGKRWWKRKLARPWEALLATGEPARAANELGNLGDPGRSGECSEEHRPARRGAGGRGNQRSHQYRTRQPTRACRGPRPMRQHPHGRRSLRRGRCALRPRPRRRPRTPETRNSRERLLQHQGGLAVERGQFPAPAPSISRH
jgi:hypothetical protein